MQSKATTYNGATHWYKVLPDGTLSCEHHRVDGPAIEYPDGGRLWYVDGVLHRVAGPAIQNVNGRWEWWHEGRLHRQDAPAVVLADGYCEWWLHGQRHRKDGPAIQSKSRGMFGIVDRVLRLLGGRSEPWYWYGQVYTKEDHPYQKAMAQCGRLQKAIDIQWKNQSQKTETLQPSSFSGIKAKRL